MDSYIYYISFNPKSETWQVTWKNSKILIKISVYARNGLIKEFEKIYFNYKNILSAIEFE